MSKQEENNNSSLDSTGMASFKGSNVGRPVNGFTESSVPLGAIRAMKGMAGMEGMGIMRVIRPSGTDTPCYSSVRQYGGYGGYGAPGDKSAPVAAPDPSQPSTDLTAPASIPRRGPGRPRKVPPPLNLTHTQVPLAPKPDRMSASKQRSFSQPSTSQGMIQPQLPEHIAGKQQFSQSGDVNQTGNQVDNNSGNTTRTSSVDERGDTQTPSLPPGSGVIGNTPTGGTPQGLPGNVFLPGGGTLPLHMEPLTPLQVQQVNTQAYQQAQQQLQSIQQQEHQQLLQQHQVQMQALRQQQEAQQHPIRRHALSSEALNEYRQQQQLEHQQQQQQLLQQHQQQIQQLQQKHQKAMEYRQEQLFKEIEQQHLIQYQATLLAMQMSRTSTDSQQQQALVNSLGVPNFMALTQPGHQGGIIPQTSPQIDGQQQPLQMPQMPQLPQQLPQDAANFGPSPMAWLQNMYQQMQLQSTLAGMHNPYDRPLEQYQQQIQQQIQAIQAQQAQFQEAQAQVQAQAVQQAQLNHLQPKSEESNSQNTTVQDSSVDKPNTHEAAAVESDEKVSNEEKGGPQEPNSQEPGSQASVTQEPATQEPTAMEPNANEPTAKESTTQESAAHETETHEPATQDSTTQDSKAEGSKTQNFKSVDSPKQDLQPQMLEQPTEKPEEHVAKANESPVQETKAPDAELQRSRQSEPSESSIPQERPSLNAIEPATIKLEPSEFEKGRSEVKQQDSVDSENQKSTPEKMPEEAPMPRDRHRNASSADESTWSSGSLPSLSSVRSGSSASLSEPVSAKRRPAPLPIARFSFPHSAPNSAVPPSSGTPPNSAPGSAIPPTDAAPNSAIPTTNDTPDSAQLQNPADYVGMDPFSAMQSYYQKLLQTAGSLAGQPGMHPSMINPFSPFHPSGAPAFGFPNQLPFGMGLMPQNMQLPNGMPSAWPNASNGMSLPVGIPGMMPPPIHHGGSQGHLGGALHSQVPGQPSQQSNPTNQMDFMHPISIGPITPLTPLTPSNSQAPNPSPPDQFANNNTNQSATVAPFNTPDGRQKLDNKLNGKPSQTSGQGGSTSVFRVGRSYQSFNPPNESNTGGVFTGRRPPGRPRKYALRTLGSIPPVVLPSGVNATSKTNQQPAEMINNKPPARFRIDDSDSDSETNVEIASETVESGEPFSKRPKRQSLVSNLPRPPPPPRPRGRRPFKAAKPGTDDEEGQNADGSQKIPRSERYWLDQQSQFMNDLDEMGFEVVMTSDYTYMCSLCGKSFNSRLLCIRHAAEHLSRKAFWCIECGLEFTRCDTLQRHYKGRCEKRLADRAGRTRPIVKEHWEVRTNNRDSAHADDIDDKMDVEEPVESSDTYPSEYRTDSTSTIPEDKLVDRDESNDSESRSRAPAPVMPKLATSDDRTEPLTSERSQKPDELNQPDHIKPEGEILISNSDQRESKPISRAPAPVMPLNSKASESTNKDMCEKSTNSEQFSSDTEKRSLPPSQSSIPDPVQPPTMTSC